MVDKISIIIGLEGGAELKRQLEQLGAAGQKAFLDIAKAAEKVGTFQNIDPTTLASKFKKVSKLSVDEIGKIQKALEGAIKTEQTIANLTQIENGFVKAGTAALKFAGVHRQLFQVTGALGEIATALGPLGLAAGVVALALAGVAKVAYDAAQGILKIEEAAAKAGVSIEKYDRLRAALEKVGVSGKGAADAIQKISDAGEQSKIDAIATSVKELQKVIASGSDVRTSALLQPLLTMAQGFGPVADAAKAALASLNIQFTQSEQRLQELASSGTQSLAQLAGGFKATVPGVSAYGQAVAQLSGKTGEADGTLMAFVRQLEGIRDPAERNALAFQQMGQAGLEIARAINTGALSSKQSIDQLTAGVTTMTQAMANSSAQVDQSINRMLTSIDRLRTAQVGEMWTTFASNGTTAITQVSTTLDGLISKLHETAKLLGSIAAGGGGGGELPGHASGGLLGGRGTGTSDSNLAWVSRGEHIMPARAVAQPGVLAFLEALRRSGGNLSRVLDRMGHFAVGGLVTMPAFAGGVGGGMSHVTIQFPGMPAVSGLRASSNVVDELKRQAAMAQVRSGGRKPSRYT